MHHIPLLVPFLGDMNIKVKIIKKKIILRNIANVKLILKYLVSLHDPGNFQPIYIWDILVYLIHF